MVNKIIVRNEKSDMEGLAGVMAVLLDEWMSQYPRKTFENLVKQLKCEKDIALKIFFSALWNTLQDGKKARMAVRDRVYGKEEEQQKLINEIHAIGVGVAIAQAQSPESARSSFVDSEVLYRAESAFIDSAPKHKQWFDYYKEHYCLDIEEKRLKNKEDKYVATELTVKCDAGKIFKNEIAKISVWECFRKLSSRKTVFVENFYKDVQKTLGSSPIIITYDMKLKWHAICNDPECNKILQKIAQKEQQKQAKAQATKAKEKGKTKEKVVVSTLKKLLTLSEINGKMIFADRGHGATSAQNNAASAEQQSKLETTMPKPGNEPTTDAAPNISIPVPQNAESPIKATTMTMAPFRGPEHLIKAAEQAAAMRVLSVRDNIHTASNGRYSVSDFSAFQGFFDGTNSWLDEAMLMPKRKEPQQEMSLVVNYSRSSVSPLKTETKTVAETVTTTAQNAESPIKATTMTMAPFRGPEHLIKAAEQAAAMRVLSVRDNIHTASNGRYSVSDFSAFQGFFDGTNFWLDEAVSMPKQKETQPEIQQEMSLADIPATKAKSETKNGIVATTLTAQNSQLSTELATMTMVPFRVPEHLAKAAEQAAAMRVLSVRDNIHAASNGRYSVSDFSAFQEVFDETNSWLDKAVSMPKQKETQPEMSLVVNYSKSSVKENEDRIEDVEVYSENESVIFPAEIQSEIDRTNVRAFRASIAATIERELEDRPVQLDGQKISESQEMFLGILGAVTKDFIKLQLGIGNSAQLIENIEKNVDVFLNSLRINKNDLPINLESQQFTKDEIINLGQNAILKFTAELIRWKCLPEVYIKILGDLITVLSWIKYQQPKVTEGNRVIPQGDDISLDNTEEAQPAKASQQTSESVKPIEVNRVIPEGSAILLDVSESKSIPQGDDIPLDNTEEAQPAKASQQTSESVKPIEVNRVIPEGSAILLDVSESKSIPQGDDISLDNTEEAQPAKASQQTSESVKPIEVNRVIPECSAILLDISESKNIPEGENITLDNTEEAQLAEVMQQTGESDKPIEGTEGNREIPQGDDIPLETENNREILEGSVVSLELNKSKAEKQTSTPVKKNSCGIDELKDEDERDSLEASENFLGRNGGVNLPSPICSSKVPVNKDTGRTSMELAYQTQASCTLFPRCSPCKERISNNGFAMQHPVKAW